MTVNGYVNTTPLSPKIRTEKLFTRIKLTPNFLGEGLGGEGFWMLRFSSLIANLLGRWD